MAATPQTETGLLKSILQQQEKLTRLIEQKDEKQNRHRRRALLNRGQGVAAALGVVTTLLAGTLLSALFSPPEVFYSTESNVYKSCSEDMCELWKAMFGYGTSLGFLFAMCSLILTVVVAIGYSQFLFGALVCFLIGLGSIGFAVLGISMTVYLTSTPFGIAMCMILTFFLAFVVLVLPGFFLHLYMTRDSIKKLRLPNSLGKDEVVKGTGPIHHAAYFNKKHIALITLAAGEDVDDTDKNGSTALHYAAYRGSYDVAKVLLDENPVVDAADRAGWTPLHLAIVRQKYEESLPRASSIFSRSSSVSIEEENITQMKEKIIDLLVDSGAKLESHTGLGNTPLLVASLKNEPRLFRCLAKLGGNVLATDKQGMSCLHIAAKYGFVEIAKAIMESSSPETLAKLVLARTNGTKNTPMHYAIEAGNFEFWQSLIGMISSVNKLEDALHTRNEFVRNGRNSCITPLDMLVEGVTARGESSRSEDVDVKWLRELSSVSDLLPRIPHGIAEKAKKLGRSSISNVLQEFVAQQGPRSAQKPTQGSQVPFSIAISMGTKNLAMGQ